MISAREAALLVLYEVFFKGAYSNLALKSFMADNRDMIPPEKGLLTTLVYGVISRHFTLDHVIRQYARVKKRDKYIQLILELGMYQLLYTDKIPQSAAVDQSVRLAKKYCRGGAERFVNAVLRSFCRDGCRINYPDDETDRIAVEHSYSREMAEAFIKYFGSRAEPIMAALNEPPRLVLRANTMKITAAELADILRGRGTDAETGGGDAIYCGGFDVGADKLYREGFYSVQDEAAQQAAIALDPKEGETVIDMCAAPGGKSTHIAQLQRDTGRVLAFDIYDHKIKLINESAKRLGLNSITARKGDATAPDPSLLQSADRVLCDVPCSGWGIIRRKPDIKLGAADIDALTDIQLKILKGGAGCLKRGGTLVYSTCTIDPRENEAITDAFLNGNGEFEKIYEKTYYPDTDKTDGFYICKMKRK